MTGFQHTDNIPKDFMTPASERTAGSCSRRQLIVAIIEIAHYSLALFNLFENKKQNKNANQIMKPTRSTLCSENVCE